MIDIKALRVLIVDDHFLARQIVTNVMTDHGVTNVEVASDGREARDALYEAQKQGRPFDVVFLDWNMPVIEGIDVLKHFRAHPDFTETAFVMITAATDKSEVMEAVRAGATAYIAKPVARGTVSKKFLDVVEWLKKARIAKHARITGAQAKK